jgi:hypothetical protein
MATETAPVATATQVPPSATATSIPPTSTFTPTPTISLPIRQHTPVPASSSKITAENVKDLQEIARYYGQLSYIAKITADKKFLFILDPDGITKYDYASMKVVTYISLPNRASDLQISNDGMWLMIDSNWLLNLKNDKEPVTYVLSEKLDLINFYAKTFVLSPDGSVIIVAEVRCYDTCNNKLQMVSTENFEVLYVSSGINYLGVPTFSPDGKYFALAEIFIEAHPDGSTNPIGISVGVWAVKDFSKVKSLTVKSPFDVSSLAFSEDNGLIAIAHLNTIDMYDLTSDSSEPYQITGLCKSYQRRIMFAPVSPAKLVENSDCSSGTWVVSGNRAISSTGNVPNLSAIAFDEKGNPSAIPYPQPTSDFSSYQWYSFYFPNNDTISFRDLYSGGRICELPLVNSSIDCQSNSNGRNTIRATNGQSYSYLASKTKVDIYSSDDPSQVYFSIPFTGFLVQLLALDPVNNVIYYNIVLSTNINRIVIQDITNKDILAQWEGETFVSAFAFSESKDFVGLCRKIGYTNRPNGDKLTIFSPTEKRVVYNMDFTCSGTTLALSNDGSKLAAEYYYMADAATTKVRVSVLNTMPPYKREMFDLNSSFSQYALAFTPDDTMLAVGCGGIEICFLDPVTGNVIQRFNAHSQITNLAFSKDGSLFAAASSWNLISLWAVPPFINNPDRAQPIPASSNPGFFWDFNQDGDSQGWEAWNQLDPLQISKGNLTTRSSGNDPFMGSPKINVDASTLPHIKINMKASAGDTAELYFITNMDGTYDESKVLRVPITGDGEFHTYDINMSTSIKWSDKITQIRFDPTTTQAEIEIDYIYMLP